MFVSCDTRPEGLVGWFPFFVFSLSTWGPKKRSCLTAGVPSPLDSLITTQVCLSHRVDVGGDVGCHGNDNIKYSSSMTTNPDLEHKRC